MPDLHVTLPSGVTVGVSHAGKSFARRIVLMCNPADLGGVVDPDPLITAERDVRLLTVDPVTLDEQDETHIGPEQHAELIAEYVHYVRRTAHQLGEFEYGPIGVVGWGTGALTAIALASAEPNLIDRLALVQPGFRIGPLSHPEPVDPYTESHATGLDGRIQRALHERELPESPELTDEHATSVYARWLDTLHRFPPGQLYHLHTDATNAPPINEPFPAELTDYEARTDGALDTLTHHWRSVVTHVCGRDE